MIEHVNLCFDQGEIHNLNNIIANKICQNIAAFPTFYMCHGDIELGQNSKRNKADKASI